MSQAQTVQEQNNDSQKDSGDKGYSINRVKTGTFLLVSNDNAKNKIILKTMPENMLLEE